MAPLLSVTGLNKAFGALTVADDVSFDVAAGQALGIIGPNGAGKSTLFNLIGGSLAPSSGRIDFSGAEITRHPAAARCHMGISRSFQIPHPFIGMSVYENLLVAAAFGGRARKQQQAHCHGILSRTGLLPKANVKAAQLTLLERKRLELARALASDPKLVLLDEIAGGLTEAECHDLVATIRQIKEQGVAILWIEHVTHALTAVVDELLVIDFGRIVARGAPDTVMADPLVQEIYMGIAVDDDVA